MTWTTGSRGRETTGAGCITRQSSLAELLCFDFSSQPGGKEAKKQKLIKGFVFIFRACLGIGGGWTVYCRERSARALLGAPLHWGCDAVGKEQSCLEVKGNSPVSLLCVNLYHGFSRVLVLDTRALSIPHPQHLHSGHYQIHSSCWPRKLWLLSKKENQKVG